MRWIIGDVHGWLKPLEALLRTVETIDSQARFIFAGDYINRGPDSKQLVELLLSLRTGRFLRGNHDDIFDQILNHQSLLLPDSPIDPVAMYRSFCDHGLVQTLQSYGLSSQEIARPFQSHALARLQELAELIPATHRGFFRNLPSFIEDSDFFLVHGKWSIHQTRTPATSPSPLPVTSRREMLWGRFSEADLAQPPQWPKPGFFGHTPVQTYIGREDQPIPIQTGSLTLLDTGIAVAVGGRLSAVSVESGQVLQVDREAYRVG